MNARINWEVPWAEVPVRDKAKLFEVVSSCINFTLLRIRLMSPARVIGPRPTSISRSIQTRLGHGGNCQAIRQKQAQEPLRKRMAGRTGEVQLLETKLNEEESRWITIKEGVHV